MKIIGLTLIMILSIGSIASGQAIWKSIGPNVGNIVRLEKGSNESVFAGSTLNAGVNRTTDGGISWKKISANYRFFAAEENHLFDAPESGTTLRYSSDYGETWIARQRPSNASIVQVYLKDGFFYVATSQGLYCSTDFGLSFARIRSHSHAPQIYVFGIARSPTGTIFCSGNYTYPTYEQAYYRSTDQGQTWTQMTWLGMGPHWAFNSMGHIFVGTDAGVWRSSDNGGTWVQVSTELHVKSLDIDQSDRILIGTDQAVLRSTDHGASWTTITSGMSRRGSGNLICITPQGKLFSGSSSGPIYSSTDFGENWAESGMPLVAVDGFGIAPDGKFFMAPSGYGHTAFCSTNRGATWYPTGFDDPRYHEFLFADTVYVGLHSYAIDRSSRNSATWARTYLGQSISDNVYSGVVTRQRKIFVGTGRGIARSDDFANSWSRVLFISSVRCLVEDFNEIIYAGGLGNFLKSSDNGQTWTTILESKPMHALACTPSGAMIAGTPSGFERSTNGGSTWSVTLQTGVQIKGFLIRPEKMLAATYGWGILQSTDDGNSWTQLTEQPPSLWLTSIAIDSNKYVYVGSDGDGIFRSPSPLTAIWAREKALPEELVLHQNYPNPFNPTTRIAFEVPERMIVRIKVHDILGREVASLIDGEVDAGNHEKIFDASRLSSGVYFCTLNAGKCVKTRKLLLVH